MSSVLSRSRQSKRIALWGLFGQGNIGNECTLEAMAANLKLRAPDAELLIICTGPDEASRWHRLPAVRISARQPSEARRRGVLRKVLSRVLAELCGWREAFHVMKGTGMLAITGTGPLTDYNCAPLNRPYDMFRWAVAARFRGCRLAFVSVGVGPIHSPISRWFFKRALGLAHFRSYRDVPSKTRLEQVGFDTSRDSIFPDLAFSLPHGALEQKSTSGGGRPQIGIGVMDYHGQKSGLREGIAIYDAYLNRTADFVKWLVAQGYAVRILHGDMHDDQQPREDLKRKLELLGLNCDGTTVIDEEISSVGDLMRILQSVELVVSPRFHNQLLALMLGKPVISISYDPKSDALLEGVGLGRYIQPIEDLDVARLIAQFADLRTNFASLREHVRERSESYRRMLDEQYSILLLTLR